MSAEPAPWTSVYPRAESKASVESTGVSQGMAEKLIGPGGVFDAGFFAACAGGDPTPAASNAATNNIAGSYFTFIGIATPTVLLVDAYDTAAE